jgi:acetolactate synthase I/II/III large subunit
MISSAMNILEPAGRVDAAAKPLRATRVYERIADELARAGVECLFGVLGEDTGAVVVAAADRGIPYYPARHENHAVAMADGFARTSGRLGVAVLTGGPGFTNALTAICTAHRAGSHVLVITGTGRPQEDDREPGVVQHASGASWLKQFPHAAVLEAAGVPAVKPLTAAAAVSDTARAIALARNSTAVLILGRPLLLEKALDAPQPAVERNGQLQDERTAPDPERIGELADYLQETWAVKQPLILAGRGAVEASAGAALRRLGEQVGALLSTTLRARGLFDGDEFSIGVCGTHSTPAGSELITQSDCVLAFGASLNPWTTYRNTLFPNAVLVQVDEDASAMGRFLPAAISIQGDVKEVAEALVAELEKRGHSSAGCRNDHVRRAIASHRDDADVKDKGTGSQVDPRMLMMALDGMLPEERILCVDAGQQARFAIRYIRTRDPRHLVYSIDFGGLGLGFGTAAGAAIANRQTLVVCAVGDGGAMMALGDLESLARLRLPVLVVISNDEAYGAEVNALAELGLQTKLAETPAPSFEAMARSMGAHAATIRRVADLEVVERWMRERSSLPLVLDCRVNPAVRTE